MTLKNKHIGSTMAMVFGVLMILSWIGSTFIANQPNKSFGFSTGVIIILGAIAYRSKKKQIFGGHKKWPIAGVITVALLLRHLFIGIFGEMWYYSPLHFMLIPSWIVIAYLSLFFIKPELYK